MYNYNEKYIVILYKIREAVDNLTRSKRIGAWRRIWMIVSMAIVFYFEILVFEKRSNAKSIREQRIDWDRLLKSQAIRFRETAIQLQGLLVKVGQFLSARADIMPESFTTELKSLTDRVPPMDQHVAFRILREEWVTDYEMVLSSIGDRPVASASIADVYRAKLKSGTDVAVKIQRDGIEGVIRTDFKAIRIVIWLMKRFTDWGKWTDLDRLFYELKETMSKELDFLVERRHARQFQKQHSNDTELIIPHYFDEFCTHRVLVMEWMDAKPISDFEAIELTGLGMVEINRRLTRQFLTQVLEHGFFHADPHPGNVLLRHDGKIVWIDFGMMGMILPEDIVNIRRCILSLVTKDYLKVVESLEKLQFLNERADHKKLAIVIDQLLDLYLSKSLQTVGLINMQDILFDLREFVQKQPIQLPAQYAFLGRAFSLVSGVMSDIDPNVDFVELGKPVVTKWVQVNAVNSIDWRAVVTSLHSSFERFKQLPEEFISFLREPRERALRAELTKAWELKWSTYEKQLMAWSAMTFFMWIGLYAIWKWIDPVLSLWLSVAFVWCVGFVFRAFRQLRSLHKQRFNQKEA